MNLTEGEENKALAPEMQRVADVQTESSLPNASRSRGPVAKALPCDCCSHDRLGRKSMPRRAGRCGTQVVMPQWKLHDP